MKKRFDVNINITKFTKAKNGIMKIEGIASDPTIDRDEERFSEEAVKQMHDQVVNGNIPIRVEHMNKFYTSIGVWTYAEMQDDKLYVKGEVDTNLSLGKDLKIMLEKGAIIGLSVGGYILDSAMDYIDDLKRSIQVFTEVMLEEISVVANPSNYSATGLAIGKSIKENKEYKKEDMKEVSNEEFIKQSKPIKKSLSDTNIYNYFNQTTMIKKDTNLTADEVLTADNISILKSAYDFMILKEGDRPQDNGNDISDKNLSKLAKAYSLLVTRKANNVVAEVKKEDGGDEEKAEVKKNEEEVKDELVENTNEKEEVVEGEDEKEMGVEENSSEDKEEDEVKEEVNKDENTGETSNEEDASEDSENSEEDDSNEASVNNTDTNTPPVEDSSVGDSTEDSSTDEASEDSAEKVEEEDETSEESDKGEDEEKEVTEKAEQVINTALIKEVASQLVEDFIKNEITPKFDDLKKSIDEIKDNFSKSQKSIKKSSDEAVTQFKGFEEKLSTQDRILSKQAELLDVISKRSGGRQSVATYVHTKSFNDSNETQKSPNELIREKMNKGVSYRDARTQIYTELAKQ